MFPRLVKVFVWQFIVDGLLSLLELEAGELGVFGGVAVVDGDVHVQVVLRVKLKQNA